MSSLRGSIILTAEFHIRYWISTEHYSPGGPMVVHDVGESDAEASAKNYWAAIGQNTEPGKFRFLSLNRSLADLPHFARTFRLPSTANIDLFLESAPWIIVGCSYSGVRAALARSRYPETFHAAYAASAPVQLQVKLDRFLDPVYEKMVDHGYESCARDLHAALQYLDLRLSNPLSVSLIKRQMLGPGAEVNDNGISHSPLPTYTVTSKVTVSKAEHVV